MLWFHLKILLYCAIVLFRRGSYQAIQKISHSHRCFYRAFDSEQKDCFDHYSYFGFQFLLKCYMSSVMHLLLHVVTSQLHLKWTPVYQIEQKVRCHVHSLCFGLIVVVQWLFFWCWWYWCYYFLFLVGLFCILVNGLWIMVLAMENNDSLMNGIRRYVILYNRR